MKETRRGGRRYRIVCFDFPSYCWLPNHAPTASDFTPLWTTTILLFHTLQEPKSASMTFPCIFSGARDPSMRGSPFSFPFWVKSHALSEWARVVVKKSLLPCVAKRRLGLDYGGIYTRNDADRRCCNRMIGTV